MAKREVVYLATPYSVGSGGGYGSADTGTAPADVKQARFFRACEKAAELMARGFVVFSPIAHSHSVEEFGMMGNIQTGDFWLEQDLEILSRCDKLFVYMMPDWERSRGIAREIAFAKNNKIPIEYLPYETVRTDRETTVA